MALRREGRPVVDLTESNPTRCGFVYPESELLRTLEFCVSRRRFLNDLAVNRFKMGHWMTDAGGLPGRPSSSAARDLNSFDVPYEADGVPIERFLELKSKAERIVNGHSEGPAPRGTPGG